MAPASILYPILPDTFLLFRRDNPLSETDLRVIIGVTVSVLLALFLAATCAFIYFFRPRVRFRQSHHRYRRYHAFLPKHVHHSTPHLHHIHTEHHHHYSDKRGGGRGRGGAGGRTRHTSWFGIRVYRATAGGGGTKRKSYLINSNSGSEASGSPRLREVREIPLRAPPPAAMGLGGQHVPRQPPPRPEGTPPPPGSAGAGSAAASAVGSVLGEED